VIKTIAMKKVFTLVLLAAAMSVGAQLPLGEMITFHGKLTKMDLKDSTEKPLEGGRVEFWHNGELMGAAISIKKGIYTCSLPFRKDYVVKYGVDPYVTKLVLVDLQKFYDEAEDRDLKMEIDVALFEKGTMGDVFDFMSNTPVAKAQYIPRKKTLVWDEKYQRTVQARMTSILASYRNK
jgi:hypothetical protein